MVGLGVGFLDAIDLLPKLGCFIETSIGPLQFNHQSECFAHFLLKIMV